ncbi:Rho termination factor N-terminal domain-containing protein [Oscillatoria acuminata]|uniref:Rho termination factor n=1 Tax=Oscillatoria acuminata PCC 6304 TaxID=56110 RepID=K9THU5_9CYAN|nr:Rho termination factor N-terminal domain-containing protein [Oscillatoria acuminata]AFY82437.1 Rho termination factor [Oscillatoria acuminata PCC 6304]
MVKKEDTSDPRDYDILYRLDLEQLRSFAAQYKVKDCQTMSKSEIVEAIKELSRINDEQHRKSKRSRRK